MLAVTMTSKNLLKHVVRSPNVYLIPRSNGLLAIGATLEEAGFDKQTVPETIKRLTTYDTEPEGEDGKQAEAKPEKQPYSVCDRVGAGGGYLTARLRY